MTHIHTKISNYIKESNISKNRNFPTYGNSNRVEYKKSSSDETDMYHIYTLNKREIGKYLNTWFNGRKMYSKSKADPFLIKDEMWTVKKVDSETADSLYRKIYNPVSITIFCPVGAKFTLNDRGEKLYDMRATICSIDDSSFGMAFYSHTISELEELRIKLMKWLDSFDKVNGEKWFEFGKSLGANEFYTD